MTPIKNFILPILALFLLLSACGPSVSKLEREGLEAYDNQQFGTVQRSGEKLLAIDSLNAIGWMFKAARLAPKVLPWYEPEFKEALQAVNKAIDNKPDLTEAYIIKAKIYRRWLDSEKLAETLDKALALEPANIKNLNFAGESYNVHEMYPEAVEIYTRLIQLDSSVIENWTNRGVNYRLAGKFDRAEDDLLRSAQLGKKAVNKEWEKIYTYTQLAKLSENMERYKQVPVYWDTVIQISEGYMAQDSSYDMSLYNHYYNCAESNQRIGNNREALINLTKAIDLWDFYYKGYFKRALVQIELEDFEAACLDLQKVDSLFIKGDNRHFLDSLISTHCQTALPNSN